MLSMQNLMNKVLHEQWYLQGWDYMRASALEGGEAIEHHGWKWWKAQSKNLPQLQMELIDIWHFYLSRYLQINNGNELQALNQILHELSQDMNHVIFDGKNYEISKLSLLDKLDLLIGLACAKRMSLGVFFSLCADCQLSIQKLYVQYVQKNTLNIFRQSNGYRQGTYHKEWFDEEDNEYLVKNAKALDSNDDLYAQKLWDSLVSTYAQALEYHKNKKSI